MNDHWEPRITIHWERTKEAPSNVRCEECQGKGSFSRGSWGLYCDDPDYGTRRTCSVCKGQGIVNHPDLLPVPSEWPKDLYEACNTAMKLYWRVRNNEMENNLIRPDSW